MAVLKTNGTMKFCYTILVHKHKSNMSFFNNYFYLLMKSTYNNQKYIEKHN